MTARPLTVIHERPLVTYTTFAFKVIAIVFSNISQAIIKELAKPSSHKGARKGRCMTVQPDLARDLHDFQYKS